MAGRGRIIYPGFWSDGNIVRLSAFARLFYIGTWNFAYCDKGHLPDDAFDLKMKILPADPVDPDELLAELVGAGRVVREEGPRGSFLRIPKYRVHQKADDPRWPRQCPICAEHDGALPSTTEHGVEGKGEVGIGVGGGPARYCPKHPRGTEGGCFGCRDARLEWEKWDAARKAPKSPGKTCRHRYVGGYCANCSEREPNA